MIYKTLLILFLIILSNPVFSGDGYGTGLPSSAEIQSTEDVKYFDRKDGAKGNNISELLKKLKRDQTGVYMSLDSLNQEKGTIIFPAQSDKILDLFKTKDSKVVRNKQMSRLLSNLLINVDYDFESLEALEFLKERALLNELKSISVNQAKGTTILSLEY